VNHGAQGPRFDGDVECQSDVLLAPHVRGREYGPDLRGDRISSGVRQVDNHHLGASGDEPLGRCQTEAGRTAGHDHCAEITFNVI